MRKRQRERERERERPIQTHIQRELDRKRRIQRLKHREKEIYFSVKFFPNTNSLSTHTFHFKPHTPPHHPNQNGTIMEFN